MLMQPARKKIEIAILFSFIYRIRKGSSRGITIHFTIERALQVAEALEAALLNGVPAAALPTVWNKQPAHQHM